MKKSIFLFFAAILCSVSAWADVTWKGGYFYFDNSLGVNKGYVMLCGRRHKENGSENWYTAVTQFNKTAIDGTKLYYTKTLEGSTWSTSTWNGWAVISDANKWNNGNFDGWSGAGWCSAYRGDQSFNGTSTYLLIPTSTAKSKTINVDTYSDYKGLNKSQTLYKYTSTDNGTSYSEVSINSGTVTISAYKMTGNGTASNDGNTATIDASSTSTSIDAVYTSEVTLTAQANDGYKFNGWYDVETGGTALSTNTSYTYTAANETKTIYARFIQTAEETHDVTVSYMCGSESIKAAETVTKVGEETTTKVTAATIPFYTFSGWELGTGVTSTDDLSASSINIKTLSTGDYTLTANYTAIPTSTVYLVNNSDWTKVYAYGWDGTKGETPAWPGAVITANKLAEKYEDYDVYSYKVEEGSYGKVIFNNGSDKQTATFDWTDGKYYYAVDPLGSNVYLAGEMTNWGTDQVEFKKTTAEATTASVTVNLTAKSYTFKLVRGEDWFGNYGTMQRGGDGVHEGGWSFDETAYDANCTIVADYPGDYTFTWNLETKKLTVTYPALPKHQVTATVNPAETGEVTGTGEYEQGSKATLVATPAAGYTFKNWTVAGIEKSVEATYTFTVTEAIELVANFVPEVTHEVTVSYLCNSNPIPGHDATTLAVGVTTPSTFTAPAITNYKFDSWTVGTGVQAVDANANPIQITTKAEGEYTLTANYTKIELTYTVTVPEGTEKCYIAGDMNSWSFQEMTPTANANEFTITIDGATTAHKYKYTCGEGWAYVEKKADGSDLDADRTYNANDVVAKWGDPLATNVFLAGEMTNPENWDINKKVFKKATADATTASVTVALTANKTYKFKLVIDGAWKGNTGTMKRGGESVHEGGWSFDKDGYDDNCQIVADIEGDYTFTWNLTTKKLTVTYPVQFVTPSVESGIFSVGEGKYVQFSTGNLQYEVGTNTWSFASKQYEVIGGEAYTGSNNTNYGMNEPGYTGKLDLFGWSSDGKFGVNPSNTDADYGYAGSDFVDWGELVNETGWYTLTKEEMNHILARTKDGKKLWALATVCGMNGLILLPDNWNTSITLDYGYVPANFNYTKNQIDDATWQTLEAAGAVFLPEGGTRVGGHGNKDQGGGPDEFDAHDDYFHVDNVGSMGYYWLNTQDTRDDYQDCASFLILPGWSDNGTPNDESDDKAHAPQVWSREKRRGNSVRLVKAIEPTYTRDNQTTGAYGTVCYKEDIVWCDGATLYEVAGKEGNKVIFDEVTTPEAGMPYIFIADQEKVNFFCGSATATEAGEHNSLQGTFTQIDPAVDNILVGNYMLVNNIIKKCGINCGLLANRAYFVATDLEGLEAPQSQMPGRRRISLNVTSENTTTGLDNITNGENTTIKVIENGQLIIIRNGEKFNAQGQKL